MEQREAVQVRIEKTKARSDELRPKLERETATLATLAEQERVDEASLFAQLDKVLDVEREIKHLHVGLVVAIKNLLTSEQQIKLREIAKDGGTQLTEETRKRLSEKVERVNEIARKWVESGRDPSDIARTMAEKFKPLIEVGKVIEAEAELDRLLERLKPDTK
jgi:ribosome maturation protein Sdo1